VKNKKIIIASLLVFISIIAFSPIVHGFRGTVVADEIVVTRGAQSGRLTDIQSFDDKKNITWAGVYVLPVFEILVNVYFPQKYSVGTGNTLKLRFKFTGGNDLQVRVYYRDGTYDVHYETGTPWDTKYYDLADYKVVDFVWFWNVEWWGAGVLKVDYIGVNY